MPDDDDPVTIRVEELKELSTAAAARPVPNDLVSAPTPTGTREELDKPREPTFVKAVLEGIPDSSWRWRHGYAEMRVPPTSLLDAATTLRDAGFDYLSFITEVDWQDRLELIYHLFAYDYKSQSMGAILRCDLPRDAMPAVASVTSVWPGAEFMEREAFEMMGIRFVGHPDLRRILLPDDFVGFPMRRDYATDFEYVTVKQLVRESD
jgi:NADH-quinone oxidoreductase subunit C